MDTTTLVLKNQASSLVELVNGEPTTTSSVIAVTFGKRHDTVLRAIRNLDCSPDFSLRNFAEASRDVDQPNGGKATYTEYTVTRDGFAFLAMGFTGKEAAKWKEAYINAFNLMESEIHRIRYSVNRSDVLTASQAEQIRIALNSGCEKMSKERKGEFLKKGWSKLRSHFAVSYRKIPQYELTEALSLIARHTTEWELLEAPEAEPAPGNNGLNESLRDSIRAWQPRCYGCAAGGQQTDRRSRRSTVSWHRLFTSDSLMAQLLPTALATP